MLLGSARFSQYSAWALATAVSAIAIVAWGISYQWNIGHITTYQLFPLLGLLAFSIMWSHYMIGALQRWNQIEPSTLANFFKISGYIVLVLICLHPGLLIYQLWRDGMGLPPGSYMRYVGPGLSWVTLLGTVSFLIFISYEFKRFFGNRSWWHYLEYATDVAMIAIFYHALRLGSQLQQGWFRGLWLIYGVTLAWALVYKYLYRAKQKTSRAAKRFSASS